MIGTLTTPTIARTALARSALLGSSIAERSAIYPMYRKSRISSDVRRASQTHQVPYIGLPQIEPVASARKVNEAPIGAQLAATACASLILQIRPIAAEIAMFT